MKQLLKKRSTIIMLGPGGVGKTTVAAALGLAAARLGLDAGVITIDPSRRLRDALGIEKLSARPTRLEARRLRAAGLDPALRLSAMVLDVKRTWDGLVARLIKTASARRRILENSFYRNLTAQFAGAEAYAALEQLYDLHNGGRFEIAIVDTPPAAHTFEFLESPGHLVRLLESRAARWLFPRYAKTSALRLSLAGRATRFVVDQLEGFAGVTALTEVAEFFGAAAEATDEIIERLRRTKALLRSPNVCFVLVTTSEAERLCEARELVRRMDAERLRVGAIVLNRTLDERSFDALGSEFHRVPAYFKEIDSLRAELIRDNAVDCQLESVIGYLEDYRAAQLATIERAGRFAAKLPSQIGLAVVPEIEIGVRDLRGLAKLASVLTEGPSGRRFFANAAATVAPPKRVSYASRRVVR